MKDEQRKKEDSELIYQLLTCFDCVENYTFSDIKTEFDDFIKDRDLEPKLKLELNRWIVNDSLDNWMIYLDGDGFDFYGVDSDGEWMYTLFNLERNSKTIQDYNNDSSYRYATDEEILDRLSKVAVKMGYKERRSECLSDIGGIEEVNLSRSDFELANENLWIIEDSSLGYRYSNCILRNGKWAKFIETDSEKIERLEKEVKELKNKIK